MFNLATHILIEKDTCMQKGEEILGIQLAPRDYADLRNEYNHVMAQWGLIVGDHVLASPDTYLGLQIDVNRDLPAGAPLFITRPIPKRG